MKAISGLFQHPVFLCFLLVFAFSICPIGAQEGGLPPTDDPVLEKVEKEGEAAIAQEEKQASKESGKRCWLETPSTCVDEVGYEYFVGMAKIPDYTEENQNEIIAETEKAAENGAIKEYSAYIKSEIESEFQNSVVCENTANKKDCVQQLTSELIHKTGITLTGDEYTRDDSVQDEGYIFTRIRVQRSAIDKRFKELKEEEKKTAKAKIEEKTELEETTIVDNDCYKSGIFHHDTISNNRVFEEVYFYEKEYQFPLCNGKDADLYFKIDINKEKAEPFQRGADGEVQRLIHWTCIDKGDDEQALFEETVTPILVNRDRSEEENINILTKWVPEDFSIGSRYERDIHRIRTENQIDWLTRGNTFRDNAYFRLQCVNQLQLRHRQLVNSQNSEIKQLRNLEYEKEVLGNEMSTKKQNLGQLKDDYKRYRNALSSYMIVHVVHTAFKSEFGIVKPLVMKELNKLGETELVSIFKSDGSQHSTMTQIKRVAKPSIELFNQQAPRIENKYWHYAFYISFKPLITRKFKKDTYVIKSDDPKTGKSVSLEFAIFSDREAAEDHFNQIDFFVHPDPEKKTEKAFKQLVSHMLDEMEKTNSKMLKSFYEFDASVVKRRKEINERIIELGEKQEVIDGKANRRKQKISRYDQKIAVIQEKEWPEMLEEFHNINKKYQNHIGDRYVTYFGAGTAKTKGYELMNSSKQAFAEALKEIEVYQEGAEETEEQMTIFNHNIVESRNRTIKYNYDRIGFQLVNLNYDPENGLFRVGVNALFHLTETEKSVTEIPINLCNEGDRKKDELCFVREDGKNDQEAIQLLKEKLIKENQNLNLLCPTLIQKMEIGHIIEEDTPKRVLEEKLEELEQKRDQCLVVRLEGRIDELKGDIVDEGETPSSFEKPPADTPIPERLSGLSAIEEMLASELEAAKDKKQRRREQDKLIASISAINDELENVDCTPIPTSELSIDDPITEHLIELKGIEEDLTEKLTRCQKQLELLKVFDDENEKIGTMTCTKTDTEKLRREDPTNEDLEMLELKILETSERRERCKRQDDRIAELAPKNEKLAELHCTPMNLQNYRDPDASLESDNKLDGLEKEIAERTVKCAAQQESIQKLQLVAGQLNQLECDSQATAGESLYQDPPTTAHVEELKLQLTESEATYTKCRKEKIGRGEERYFELEDAYIACSGESQSGVTMSYDPSQTPVDQILQIQVEQNDKLEQKVQQCREEKRKVLPDLRACLCDTTISGEKKLNQLKEDLKKCHSQYVLECTSKPNVFRYREKNEEWLVLPGKMTFKKFLSEKKGDWKLASRGKLRKLYTSVKGRKSALPDSSWALEKYRRKRWVVPKTGDDYATSSKNEQGGLFYKVVLSSTN